MKEIPCFKMSALKRESATPENLSALTNEMPVNSGETENIRDNPICNVTKKTIAIAITMPQKYRALPCQREIVTEIPWFVWKKNDDMIVFDNPPDLSYLLPEHDLRLN